MDNTLREKAKTMLDEMPEDRLAEIIDFMEFLKQKEDKEEEEATNEILNDRDLMDSLERGMKDIKNGNVYRFEDVFKDV